MASASLSSFEKILYQLVAWFEERSRQLPWRDDPTPYRVWVSEIMLQQTQVATVIDYFNRFMDRFPTLEDLAEGEEDEVVALWSGLGYYSRARNLLKSAKIMSRQGGVPSTRRELEALPGIGPYTAGAVLSIAFNRYEAILDGNLDRVFARMLELPRTGEYKNRLWKVSWLFIRKARQLKLNPSIVNQALMEVGALLCKPKQPLCEACPLNDKCHSFKHQTTRFYPQKAKRTAFVSLKEEKLFLTDLAGRFLIVKDPQARWRKGTWDLPSFADSHFPKQLLSHVTGISNSALKRMNNKSEINFSNLVEHLEPHRFQVRLTVTHHKIERTVQFCFLENLLKPPEKPFDLSTVNDSLPIENHFWQEGELEFGWVSDIDLLPVGSPLIKSLKAVRKDFRK